MGRPVHAETIRVGGTGAALEAMRLAGEAFQKTHPQTSIAIVPGLGSRGGIKAVHAGAVDVAVTVSPVPGAEPGLISMELGRTPIIFATASPRPRCRCNHGRPRRDLLGPEDGLARRIPPARDPAPERRLGHRVPARALSPAMNRAIDEGLKLPGVKIAATDQDAANAIGSIPGAFGMSTLLQVRAEARPLALLPVGGVAPGLAALANGSYPYGKTLYLVARGESTVAVQQYVGFLGSPAGRKLLTRLGLDVSPGLTATLRSSAR